MEKITISSDENFKSEIIIEKSLLDNLDTYVNLEKAFLVTNTTLKKLYPDIISKFKKDRVIVIKDGEKYKNFKTYNFILNSLLNKKIERKDTLVALGGGVVGDIAGYAASSVLRGVNLVQIPTTLLAMVDSSIGGKTGYNTPQGKNLIGAFHLAKYVLIDDRFLKTLNDYEIRCGFGEILKYAFIEKSCKNDGFFNLIDYLEEKSVDEIKNDMAFLISSCAKLKANVVTLDRTEGGLRKVLNFGHTLGHPIETLTNYKGVSHGEAVAYGIQIASKLSYLTGKIDKDYYEKIVSLLKKFNLVKDGYLKKFKKDKMIEIMTHDKKVEDGKIKLLLATAKAEIDIFDSTGLPFAEAFEL